MSDGEVLSGHGSSFPVKKDAFVAALLRTGRIGDASRECGIHHNTGTRWASRPEVRQALREAQNAVITEAINELAHSAGLAVGTLVSICTNPDAPPSARIAAARAILEYALKRH